MPTPVVTECRPGDGTETAPWCVYDADDTPVSSHATQDEAIERLRDMVAEKAIPGIVEGAEVLFVGGCPSPLEAARGEPLIGPVGKTFRDLYLADLGATVSVAYAVPEPLLRKDGRPRQPTATEMLAWRPWLDAVVAKANPRVIVALGRQARHALAGAADLSMPHPGAVRHRGDKGEVARKVRLIRKMLEAAQRETDSPPESLPKDDAPEIHMPIAKAESREQVVMGAVLDPYAEAGEPHVDAHGDWVPPAAIRKALYGWMASSRVIGHQHERKSTAVPVEAFIFPYPSVEDQDKAERGEPHRAYVKRYGQGDELVVHSGAWVMATHIPDPDEWAMVEAGELNGYSIGGAGVRSEMKAKDRPEVEMVEI